MHTHYFVTDHKGFNVFPGLTRDECDAWMKVHVYDYGELRLYKRLTGGVASVTTLLSAVHASLTEDDYYAI
jgi:hypothetical protein